MVERKEKKKGRNELRKKERGREGEETDIFPKLINKNKHQEEK